MPLQNIHGDHASYEKAIKRGESCQTGKTILAYLKDASRPFDVVVLPAGATYGQMLTAKDRSGPQVLKAREAYAAAFHQPTGFALERPTVFWCPSYEFGYYGDVIGCKSKPNGDMVLLNSRELKHGDFYYQYSIKVGKMTNVSKVPVVCYTKGKMEPWIVLYHELGHVKQYYEGGNTKAAQDQKWDARLNDTDLIEADNLKRHENPICKEIGISIRAHYKHMEHGMVSIDQALKSPRKKAALRVASSPAERTKMDGELLSAAKSTKLHDKDGDGYHLL